MRRSRQRLIVIAAAGALLSVAVGVALLGSQDSIAYFHTPSDIAQKARSGDRVRVGGLVAVGSVSRDPGTGILNFAVTDGKGVLKVRFDGIPPDLFAENQGVVAEGVWHGGQVFAADRILAKHDEKYMPREVVDALKASGEWKGQP